MAKEYPSQEPSAKHQYLFTGVVNMLAIGYGVACGWASPSTLLLMSTDTPLASGKITIEEASWIASFLGFGGLIGNFFFAYITSIFGRKKPLLFIAIPTIASWTLIWFAENVYHLYAARLLGGIVGGGMFVIVPAFLSEIANDRVRGILGSTLVLSCNMGILIAFTFGNYFDFYAMPKLVIVLTILFVISLYFCPESPAVLIKQNKLSEAESSIRFYQNMRRNTRDYTLIQAEMEKMKSSIGEAPTEKDDDKNSWNWSDVLTNPGRKAMIIGIVLALLNQFCGCFAMLNYTANIFEEAGSSMSPNMSAIVVGIIQLIGSYMATVLVDRAGRKFLFAVSTIGTALGLITLGVYMMLKSWKYEVDVYNWIPLASFSFAIFISSTAILSLPFLVISEMMPSKLKNFGVSVCMTLLWSSQFIMLKLLPLLNETLGFHGSMFLFATVCLFSALFIILRVPETKGKSYDEIMKALQ